MTDTSNGLDAIEERFQRRQRTVPPPRRPRDDAGQIVAAQSPPESVQSMEDMAAVEASERPPAPQPQTKRRERTRPHMPVRPGEPVANLAVRVRRPLDNHLSDLVAELRRDGIRSSKSELIEMLLWELPLESDGELRSRLGAFRRAAPREEQL